MFQPVQGGGVSDPPVPGRAEGAMRRERRELPGLTPIEIPSGVYGDGPTPTATPTGGEMDQVYTSREPRLNRLDSRNSRHSRLDSHTEECSGDIAMEDKSSVARSVDNSTTIESGGNARSNAVESGGAGDAGDAVESGGAGDAGDAVESGGAGDAGDNNDTTIERGDTPSGHNSVRFNV
jgi:hypothetical protein